MKRSRKTSPARLSKEADRFFQVAIKAIGAGCRIEDRFWDAHLETVAMTLLDAGNDAAIESALDYSFEKSPDAHDLLAESVETAAETCFFAVDGQTYQALLVSIPMIAWSKYPIYAGPLSASDVTPLETYLREIIFAQDTKSVVNPFMFSIEHLPPSFSKTRKLLKKLADSAVNEDVLVVKADKIPTLDMPADTRMILAAVLAPLGKPLFRWQEGVAVPASSKVGKVDVSKKARTKAAATAIAPMDRDQCLTLWIERAKPILAKLVPGASIDCGLPDAFFRICRECDQRVRPHMVSSAVDHLETALGTTASQLHAIIAGVGDAQVDEYRVAFALRSSGDVVNGMIWPLVAQEDDDTNPGPREQIEAILKTSQVGKITNLPGVLPPEFCEDCGAPLFYDADAEAVHPHMPDDSNLTPAHYH